MKFDKIIMNPPYSRNLHLKVVEKVIKYLKDDNSVCVNLSPVRWLQDPLAKYKKNSDYNKFEKSIAQHIESVSFINKVESAKMFNAALTMDLGIYLMSHSVFNEYKSINKNNIVEKVLSKKLSVLNDKLEENKSDGWRVRLSKLRNSASNRPNAETTKSMLFETTHIYLSWVYNNGCTKDGRHWSRNKGEKAGGPKAYSENDPLPFSISFSNEEEAVNFEKSTKTTFHRYLVLTMKIDQNFPMNYVPYLGEVENPRTHKIGYESDWTNEDLCKIFGITGYISDNEAEAGSEWEEILETMKRIITFFTI